MNRQWLTFAFLAASTATLMAQQASQSGPYQGVSRPPANDTIETSVDTPPKPPAGHPMATQAAPAPQKAAPVRQSAPVVQAEAPSGYRDGTDGGIVEVAQPAPASTPDAAQPVLEHRAAAPDPDSDIVHPAPLPPGELAEGTNIRVRLLNDLSSTLSEQGEVFHSRVASDVLAGNDVVIPAGSEIDGKVVDVSSGHFAGHGSLMLRPETVILPNGRSFRLHASVTDTPMSNTHVESEGVIAPDARIKRGSIEYGGAMGAGAVAGAYLGGPAGALAGGLIGAGLVTTHLLVSHAQAHLATGDVLILTLTQNMRLDDPAAAGNNPGGK